MTFEEWLAEMRAHALSSAEETRKLDADSWGSGYDTGYSDAFEHVARQFELRDRSREALRKIEKIIADREKTLCLPDVKDIKQIWKIALAALPSEQDGAKTMREALEECVAMIRQLRLEVPTKAVAALAHLRPNRGCA